MSQNQIHINVWESLKEYASLMSSYDKHLTFLLQEEKRPEKYSVKGADIFYDFSHQRVG